MREKELDYGSFVTPEGAKKALNGGKSSDEINDKNIEKLNAHFKAKKQANPEAFADYDPHFEKSNAAFGMAGDTSGKGGDKSGDKNAAFQKKKTSIGAKLIFIISSLVILSMGLITALVSYYVTEDTSKNAEESNLTLNSRTAAGCENRLNGIISNVSFFCDVAMGEGKSEGEIFSASDNFFRRNAEIAALYFCSDLNLLYNRIFSYSNDISEDKIDSYFKSCSAVIAEAQNGSSKIVNASPFFSKSMLCIFTKIETGEKTQIVGILCSSEKLSETISTGRINESFLINDRGVILLHSDSSIMNQAYDMSSDKFISQAIQEDSSGRQLKYTDSDETEYYAACIKITDADCRVVTRVKCDVILEAIRNTTRRNIALSIAILSVAILIIWIFAKTLSVPLDKLTEVTDQINQGNFNTNLFDKLNVKRRDEIGVLNRSTKNERDILNTVTSLTNKGVTKAIVRKEIDFNPHLKDITIFFSDIRGFTAISDGFNKRFGEKSAAEIIGFLNDYMSRMVNCISITGGVVDKFEGDAVMAAWGVLRDDNLDFEKDSSSIEEYNHLKLQHEKNVKLDALSAIRATIAMRYALMKYNKDAKIFTEIHKNEPLAKYKPHIRIGCGLNSGRATVGFMGSGEKMEFTSIGDAVNLASRTESSNKPCGTDILITEDTYSILKNEFIRCEENGYIIPAANFKNEIIVEQIPVTFEVKGKGRQHFYGVVNMPNFNIEEFFKTTDPDFTVDPDCEIAAGPKGPKTLTQVREILGIPAPDFERVNLDEEENKVTVK